MRRQSLLCLPIVVFALIGCERTKQMYTSIESKTSFIQDSIPRSSPDQRSGTPKAVATRQLVGSSTGAAAAPEFVTGRIEPQAVIDGDTIIVAGRRIRLHGIDALESSQYCLVEGMRIACGTMARYVLMGFVTGAQVKCERVDIDRYGRDVSRCMADGFDLSAGLVSTGFAVAYRQYSNDYVSHEADAKQLKRGMWRGIFELPWRWRAQRRGQTM